MNYKINNLIKIVYDNYIKGKYNYPKIPTSNEVLKKVFSITDESYTSILNSDIMKTLDIDKISYKFENIIDDINILFSSIEDQSNDILDQLSNSLKEYNGIKLEFKLLNNDIKDLVLVKNGFNYIQQTFTEHFESLDNIIENKSDPVNIKDGTFTIYDNSGKNLSFNHYKGKRLDMVVSENYSPIKFNGFISITDADAILNSNDDREVIYRVKTEKPTPLNIVTQFQLNQNGTKEEINRVEVQLDSLITGGFVKLYYYTSDLWKEIPYISIQEIKNNNIKFQFRSINTSHIKLEFQKYGPDNKSTNEYFVAINKIIVGRAIPKAVSTVYSKPIKIGYNERMSYISNISCILDGDIPSETNVNLYISQDIRINGQFKDNYGNIVPASSLSIKSFDSTAEGYVYLSDIWEKFGNVSGLESYYSADFNWKQIAIVPNQTISSPEIIDFKNISSSNKNINSLAQNNVPGWYRPDSELVIHGQPPYNHEYLTTEKKILPDFKFNGLNFYKIYRFPKNSNILETSIKLLTYEDSIYSSSNKNISFIWKKNPLYTYEKRIILNKKNEENEGTNYSGWESKYIKINNSSKESFDKDVPIILKKHNSNAIFNLTEENYTIDEYGITINLSFLSDNLSLDTTFDIIYGVLISNPYEMIASSYIVVSPSNIPVEMIINDESNNINKIYITDIDSDITTIYDKSQIYNILFNSSEYTKNYKIVIECKNKVIFDIKNNDLIRILPEIGTMEIVDIATLLYNTKYNSNNYASIISEDDYKFIVVKEPPKSKLSIYYYDYDSKKYIRQINELEYIKNDSHYVRQQIINNNLITYTTGSSGLNVVNSGWNKGSTITGLENSISGTYERHTTYQEKIDLEKKPDNKGYLYYPTGENLPAYYSISYKTATADIDYVNRFLYKLQLTSFNSDGLVPRVKSLQFIVNKENEK